MEGKKKKKKKDIQAKENNNDKITNDVLKLISRVTT